MIEVIYFGTDTYSAQTLETLATAGDFKIVAVITQPDRKVGRKQTIEKPPVKLVAERYGIPVQQPDSLKVYNLEPSTYDLGIVYRYGLIIPKKIIDTPRFGTINIHPSLLPKYRGASPIQSAILNGDAETAITIMQMDEKMDHGPIISQQKVVINPDDTYDTLSQRMTPLINELLLTTIRQFVAGEIKPTPQNDAHATFCKIINRDDGKINWLKTAQEIYNQYRAFTPWPGIWTTWEGKRLKLHTLRKTSDELTPGLVEIKNNCIIIGTMQGSLEVTELQLEGKKTMNVKEFVQGYKQIDGARL